MLILTLLACADPELVLSAPESPLSGIVDLSLTGNYDQLLILVDGTVLGGGPGPGLTLSWDTSTAEEGAHVLRGQGYLGSQDPVETLLDVVVDPDGADTEAPVVRFLDPLDQDVLDAGTLSVAFEVTDAGTLQSVDLFADGELLVGLPSEGPWEADWEATTGEHLLEAVAVDEAGNSGSASVEVEVVSSAMECVLTRPLDDTVDQGEIELRAAVTSQAGLVSEVRFSVDGELLAVDEASPWSAVWDGSEVALESVHVLAMEAWDNAGNSCQDSKTVTVGEAADIELSILITAPADGSTVQGSSMPLQVAAQSDKGIQEMVCIAGGVEQGTLEAAPWKFTLDTTAFDNGPLTVEVVATELGTGAQASDSVDLTVDN